MGSGAACDWLADAGSEPAVSLLPARLWLIGLGHLGQAYLWALGLLPFARPQDLSLVLQDIDIITPSTESTSNVCADRWLETDREMTFATPQHGDGNDILKEVAA